MTHPRVEVRAQPRWFAVFWVVLPVAWAVQALSAFAEGRTLFGASFALLAVFGTVMSVGQRRARLVVDDDGLTVGRPFGAPTTTPWPRVTKVTVDWAGLRPRSRPLRVDTVDGDVVLVSTDTIGDLSTPKKGPQREALEAALRHHAEAHGFRLEIVPPTWSAAYERARRELRDR